MQVLKFGGSSVANATNISKVLDIVENSVAKGRVILVCSAIKGCTDTLLAIGRGETGSEALRIQHLDIINRLFTGSEKEEAAADCIDTFKQIDELPDVIEAFGEILSTRIIARKLACEGYRTAWLDSREIICKDDLAKTYANIAEAVADEDIDIFVAPGFIASDGNGRVTTLGRGGSDYSAALYAAGAHADNLQIWTDVPGIMTTNPKDVPSAHTIPSISYRAALDLARFGAKVLYAPTIVPTREASIPFSILNTFDPSNPGTIVSGSGEGFVPEWKGVTALNDPASDRSEIHLVGEGAVGQAAGVERMLSALRKNGVQVISYAADEDGHNISATVHYSQYKDAVAAVHSEFFEQRALTVSNVYIAGFGAVGKALVRMIGDSAGRIAEQTGRSIRICGISNSRKFVMDSAGIRPEDAEKRLECGIDASDGAFFDAVCEQASRKSVFVDCTNSEDSFMHYEDLFRKGLSIVSSNRRALAVPYARYAGLKAAARENGVNFKYDTTVGTAIPILESLASGTLSCDRVISIEAVVSCTLNYIITGYDGARKESFANLIRRAQKAGLTEKDPRSDLGGLDALRKLLILAREAGIPLEAGDVKIEPMLGPEYFDCSLEEFYSLLDRNEQGFVAMEDELDKIDQRQRFVAYVKRDESSPLGYRAGISMQKVGQDNPFYWISGTENITSVKSENISSPLVLKGSGEGAAGAASGIINDILSI